MRSAIQTLVALLLIASTAPRIALADYEAGRIAANRGDFATAFREWRPLAAAGNAQAQYGLGRMYARGDGVKKDFRAALTWFNAAAAGGEPRALFALGKIYEFGDGVKIDKEMARRFYERARIAGIPEAAERLQQLGPAPMPTSPTTTTRGPNKAPSTPIYATADPVASGASNAAEGIDDNTALGVGLFILFVFGAVTRMVLNAFRRRIRSALIVHANSLKTRIAASSSNPPITTSRPEPAPTVPVPAVAPTIAPAPSPIAGDWNPYSVLGVRPSASRDDIERAFKKLIASDRPERYAGMSESVAKLAKAETKQIRRAYAELTK